MIARIFAISFFATFMLVSNAMSQGVGDVQWCLTGDANNRIVDQPMDRGYCAWVAAGTAVGVWYGNREAQLVATMTQKGWSQQAARMTCAPDPSSLTNAVGLIAACQCHNQGAADWVLNNPGPVVAVLRSFAGC